MNKKYKQKIVEVNKQGSWYQIGVYTQSEKEDIEKRITKLEKYSQTDFVTQEEFNIAMNDWEEI